MCVTQIRVTCMCVTQMMVSCECDTDEGYMFV